MTVSALETYAANASNFAPVPGLSQRLHKAMVKDYAARAATEATELDEAIARLAAIPGTSSDRIASLMDRRDRARIRASMVY